MTGKRALYRRKLCTKPPCSVLYLVGIYMHMKGADISLVIITNPIRLGDSIDNKTFVLDINVILNQITKKTNIDIHDKTFFLYSYTLNKYTSL